MKADTEHVAMYWDFENIHASVLESEQGAGAHARSRWRPQDPVVDIDSIVAFAAGLGTVSINRAYGNWQWMHKYRASLHETAMELIQLFPLGKNAKNGADIRMALDIADDLMRYEQITDVVLVTGDSDFVAVAQAVRRAGRSVVGIGVAENTNPIWAAACDRFVYYRSLIARNLGTQSAVDASRDADEAAGLLVRAISQLVPTSSEAPWVRKAAIKPMMQRLDATFDEAVYGYDSFNSLLEACHDVVEQRIGEHDHEYRVLGARSTPASSSPIVTSADSGYEAVLRKVGWRLIDRPVMWQIVDELATVLDDDPVAEVAAIDELLVRRIAANGTTIDSLDAKKVRQIAFRSRLFATTDGGVALACEPEDVRRTIVQAAVDRLDDLIFDDDELDEAALALTLFGEPSAEDRMLVRSCIAAIDHRPP